MRTPRLPTLCLLLSLLALSGCATTVPAALVVPCPQLQPLPAALMQPAPKPLQIASQLRSKLFASVNPPMPASASSTHR